MKRLNRLHRSRQADEAVTGSGWKADKDVTGILSGIALFDFGHGSRFACLGFHFSISDKGRSGSVRTVFLLWKPPFANLVAFSCSKVATELLVLKVCPYDL